MCYAFKDIHAQLGSCLNLIELYWKHGRALMKSFSSGKFFPTPLEISPSLLPEEATLSIAKKHIGCPISTRDVFARKKRLEQFTAPLELFHSDLAPNYPSPRQRWQIPLHNKHSVPTLATTQAREMRNWHTALNIFSVGTCRVRGHDARGTARCTCQACFHY